MNDPTPIRPAEDEPHVRHEPEVVYLEHVYRHLVTDHGCSAAAGLWNQVVQIEREQVAKHALPTLDGSPRMIEIDAGDALIMRTGAFDVLHFEHHASDVPDLHGRTPEREGVRGDG